jgi:hypothetical protein
MNAMYRGSRLAASFLLFVTGIAALAIAMFVVPPVVPGGAGWTLVPVALAFAITHFVAVAGVARGRDWGRNVAVFVAEMGGGLAILGAVTLLVGQNPFGRESAAGPGLVAWAAAVYALLGIAAARMPVLTQLPTLERRRVILGPSFHGVA